MHPVNCLWMHPCDLLTHTKCFVCLLERVQCLGAHYHMVMGSVMLLQVVFI